MKQTLITHIGKLIGITDKPRLCGMEMADINGLDNAYLLIEDGKIAQYGTMDTAPEHADTIIDAKGGIVMPSYCDSHTHIVYAGTRDQEFLDKLHGLSYEEIAKRGGGILNSAQRLHETDEMALYEQSAMRLEEVMRTGTGTIEIKSGYGLTLEDELKMLRVIRRLKESYPTLIKSTLLGAHAVPKEYKGRQDDYVTLVCEQMIPAAAHEGLADFIDVFCDEGFFTVTDTDRILTAATKYGLRPKIHANELANSGGVQIGIKHNALSVDHLERAETPEVQALLASTTMPTGLPGASFFLNIPYAPTRQMVNAGLSVAIASDYNPGSSPCGDMRFIMALACIYMRLLPEEAFNAVTINGAYAMDAHQETGSIAIGKRANLILTKPVPSVAFIPYAHHTPYIQKVFLNGKEI